MFPQKPEKHAFSSYISPEQAFLFLKKIGRVPEDHPPQKMILCYQGSFMDRVQKNYRGRFSSGTFRQVYFFEDDPGVAIGDFGIGAPQVISKIEFLIAWGVKEFISIGTAGAISKELKVGDLVLCERAIRDEGTSYHYLPPGKYAYPTDGGKLAQNFQWPFRGTSWTLDAFFRHTREEIQHYQKEGVLTVEMEASALFAVAQARKVSMSAAFVVSDLLTSPEWEPHLYTDPVEKGLNQLLEIALA